MRHTSLCELDCKNKRDEFVLIFGAENNVFYFTGGGQNLRTRREVLPVADDLLLILTEVPFISRPIIPGNRGKILTHI